MKPTINTLLAVIVLLSIASFATAESCAQYDPFEYPIWPVNSNMTFGVSEVSSTNLIVSFKAVEKYIGAVQYLRMTPLDANSADLIQTPSFDSGSNATLSNELYRYFDYENMFQNVKYTSHDNEDCTVDITVDFAIQDILSSTGVFTIVEEPNVIKVDVPFYLGYAVKSRQDGLNWQFQENLFVARLVINTLVRADGTKDVLNTACSSTVNSDDYGVIICYYTSTSPLRVSDFNLDVTGSNMNFYEFYSSSSQGKSEVKFQTVEKIETSTLQMNAAVGAIVCLVGPDDACNQTTLYRSPSIPYIFKAGSGGITLEQEATMLFSSTITKFDEETDAETIIGSTPEFFLLVTTKTPKSIWRIKSGSDSFSVELTATPNYVLPSFPVFPTGNTVTVYTETNFPANVDPTVLSGPFVSYILRFDNSRQRYSRASEDPILFKVQFNIESRSARRRMFEISQPTRFTVAKSLRSQCSGAECQVDLDESSSAKTLMSLALIVVACAVAIF